MWVKEEKEKGIEDLRKRFLGFVENVVYIV